MPKVSTYTTTDQTPRPEVRQPSVGSATKKSARQAVVKKLQERSQGSDEIHIANGSESEIATANMGDIAHIVADVKYLLKNWIPYGMVTGVVAEPGVGKSAFVLWLARTVMTGSGWFTGQRGPTAGKVLLADTENGMAITLHRMKQWGIPLEELLVPFADDPLLPLNLNDDEHLERLEAVIRSYATRLVIIDSLRGSHDGDENCSRVGKVLKELATIAERTGAAIIVVHHTRKLMDGEEITANSSRGSNAILAMFRAQIGLDRPDPDSKAVRVRVLKENLGIAPKPVGFTIGESGLEFGDPPTKPRKATQQDSAADWLVAHMEPETKYRAGDLIEQAEQDGIAERTVRRASNDLGIVKQKEKDHWSWTLPPPG